MRRRSLPLLWICLGAWAFAGSAAAQAPDYAGDGLLGGADSYRGYDEAPPASRERRGQRPDRLERERVGPPYETDGRRYVPTVEPGYEQVGMASWYGADLQGRPTASGETFDRRALTAAHPTLPIPSLVQVTNLANGREAIVRVNDRGPFEPSRLIDVSRAAAEVLGFVRAGHAQVHLRYLGPAPPRYGEPVPPGGHAGSGYGGGGYVVQVGAYAELGNAQRAHAAAGAAGPVIVDTRPTWSGGLFLIRSGPWASRDEAEAARQRLVELGYADAFVDRR